jgi:hypothetical protein
MSERVTRAQFAAMHGWQPPHVTRMVQRGRIDVDGDGLIDVDAAEQRLAESADPSRDATRERWQRYRAQRDVHDEVRAERPDDSGEDGDQPPSAPTYASAKARREHALADLAEIELEKARGTLIEADKVHAEVQAVFRITREQLEMIPARLAPRLAPSIEQQHETYQLIDEEVRRALTELCERLEGGQSEAAA